MKKMTNRELSAHLEQEIVGSLGYGDGKLTQQRSDALDRYYGKKYGNEQEGRSKIVTRDVADVIEWIMPSLMKIFTGGDKIVKFEPQGPEDVETAEQATDYTNYVIMRQNPGFSIIYSWFKDALLQKNGIVKHYWDDTSEVIREEYKNLTEEEFTALLLDDNVEVKEHTVTGGIPEGATEEELLQTQPQPELHDVVVKRTYEEGQVRIENVPPEEFLINKYAKSIKEARFVAHRVKRTKSELLQQGYSKKIIEKAFSNDEADYKQERLARFQHEQHSVNPSGSIDEGLWITECYIRVDYDNDGIDELRKITKVGDEILDNEAVDSVPFSSLTPIPMPHKFYGLSIYDIISDLQLIKTTLMRNLLDNMYLTNNGRYQVVEGQANLDDLMTSRPGGIVRVRTPGAVTPLQTPQLDANSFNMLGYLDSIREERTGVSKNSMGLSEGALKSHQTASGVSQVMSAAQQKIELIARVFAETGMKDLAMSVYQLVQKYEKPEKLVRLNNKWTTLYPADWREKMDCTAQVGLGFGNKEMNLINLSRLSQTIQMIAQHPAAGMMLKPKNIYNLVAEQIRAMGMRNVNDFITDPGDEPVPQKQRPTPEEQAKQVESQLKAEELKIKAQKIQQESALKQQEMQLEAQIKQQEIELKKQEASVNMQIKAQELEIKKAELALKQQELILEREQKRPVKIGP
jgi:uncharacterized protein YacL (UPF0231 family)